MPTSDTLRGMPTPVTAFVIGDPHFKANAIREGTEFIERCISKAKKCNPTFIVCLGDILDTHEVARCQPFNLALTFIERLSAIAPFYLLIGNHDLIGNQQFLTDNHFFNPLKGRDNITIVDTPKCVEYGDKTFVFVPYVAPGRFVEALEELTKQGEAWDVADCIFAHQEFLGCKMGAIESLQGDEWDALYPPVISGHIHDAQVLGNVYYPGSAIQHAFGESPDKRVWFVTFDGEEEPYFRVEKLNLGMKGKKMVYTSLEEVEKFDFKSVEKYHIKLSIKGTTEGFKVFRRGTFHAKLVKAGVKIAYSPEKVEREALANRTREETSYRGMLRELVKEKSGEVQAVYNELLGDSVTTASDDDDDECNENDEEENDDDEEENEEENDDDENDECNDDEEGSSSSNCVLEFEE